MSHEVSECINCAVKNLDCDKAKPKCSACEHASIACSYDWTISNPELYALFPSGGDYNSRIHRFGPYSHVVGGRFGCTYRAELKSGGSVAVKKLFRDQLTGPSAILRSLQTAWRWLNVAHPNLVPLVGIADYSTICSDGLPQICLLSPWMEEGNIMQYITQHEKADRLLLLLDVTGALDYLHSCTPPIIHGGLKGSNILIETRGNRPTAVVRDFGHEYTVQYYATEYESESKYPPRLACRWAAFERISPSSFGLPSWDASHSPASDIFELMRTFLEVLSGRPPYHNFRDDRRVELVAFRRTNPDRPPDCHPALDDDMWMFILRSWSPEISQRPRLEEVRFLLKRYRVQ